MEGNRFMVDGELNMKEIKKAIKKNLIMRKPTEFGSYRYTFFNDEYRKINLESKTDPDINILYIEDYRLKVTYPNIYGIEFDVQPCQKAEPNWVSIQLNKKYPATNGYQIMHVEDGLVKFTIRDLYFCINDNFEVITSHVDAYSVNFDLPNKQVYFGGEKLDEIRTDKTATSLNRFIEVASQEQYRRYANDTYLESIEKAKEIYPEFAIECQKANLPLLKKYIPYKFPLIALFGYIINPNIGVLLNDELGEELLTRYSVRRDLNAERMFGEMHYLFKPGKTAYEVLDLSKWKLKRFIKTMEKKGREQALHAWLLSHQII